MQQELPDGKCCLELEYMCFLDLICYQLSVLQQSHVSKYGRI
jgi:hypothetical protein